MAGPERLEGRDGAIWSAYVGGATQEAIAAEHGISQQRVSQVLAEVRATIGDMARMDAALLAQERADALLAAVWPTAMDGDTKAVLAALRVLERMAKATGTDAVEPLRLSLERRLDLEGEVLADALMAVVDALQLDEARRQVAVQAAQWALGGREGPRPEMPAPSAPAVEEPGKRDLEAEFREFAEREGFDPDDLGDDEEDDDDGE